MSRSMAVVDDELGTPRSTTDLALHNALVDIANSAGFELQFFSSGEDFISSCIQDEQRFDVAILDRYFDPVHQGRTKLGMQGEDVLRALQELGRPTVVVFLTRSDSYSEAERLLQLGANRYIVKPQLARSEDKRAELVEFLKGMTEDPENRDFTLHLTFMTTHHCTLYLTDMNGAPVLKRARSVGTPLAQILLKCIEDEDHSCQFIAQHGDGRVVGLEPFTRVDIQKAVYSFNRSIVSGSCGRLQPLLQGGIRLPSSTTIQSAYGRSAFSLMIGHIEAQYTDLTETGKQQQQS